jgi:hypothetical protein
VKPSYLLAILATFIFSCKAPDRKKEIESALKTYDRLILKMDADSIAMLYTVDGDLGDIAHGRDSIRRFLATFTNVRVLSVSSISQKIVFNKDTAIQSGRFNQIAVINNKDTVKPKGTFETNWVWLRGEGWKIKKNTNTPD